MHGISLARDDLANPVMLGDGHSVYFVAASGAGPDGRRQPDTRRHPASVRRCVSLLWHSAVRAPAAPDNRSIRLPGGISLGAHRKGQAGVCQREQRCEGYQSHQECAWGCALAGELASGLRVAVSRPVGCLMGRRGGSSGQGWLRSWQGRGGPSTSRVDVVAGDTG
jgi:hypothetical protein